jgi:hypothetical protein
MSWQLCSESVDRVSAIGDHLKIAVTAFSTPDRFDVIPVFGANAILDESQQCRLITRAGARRLLGLSDARL